MRRVLVTGANRGIGLAIVAAILDEHDDTFVLLGSRDKGRGQTALDDLLAEHPGWADRIAVLELDVSSDDSVARAAETVAAAYKQLYAVVNNAGIGLGSADLKTILETNTYGVRRVCEAFLPLLDPARGRIVNITSAAGPSYVSRCSPEKQRLFVDPQIDWASIEARMKECLAIDGGKEAFEAAGLGDGNEYGISKACTNAYTVLLARENPNLTINACTPGWVDTDMTRPYAESQGKTPAQLGMLTPAQGARSAMFLLFGEPEGNGHYYGSDAVRSPLDRYREPGSPAYTGD